MVKFNQTHLDKVFTALSDPTRRQVIASLTKGSLPVTDLAAPHHMSLPGFMKHLRVLEDAGLISRNKTGRVVQCQLQTDAMREANAWLTQYEKFWSERLDKLDYFLQRQEEEL